MCVYLLFTQLVVCGFFQLINSFFTFHVVNLNRPKITQLSEWPKAILFVVYEKQLPPANSNLTAVTLIPEVIA